jgi:hypothetical protein
VKGYCIPGIAELLDAGKLMIHAKDAVVSSSRAFFLLR